MYAVFGTIHSMHFHCVANLLAVSQESSGLASLLVLATLDWFHRPSVGSKNGQRHITVASLASLVPLFSREAEFTSCGTLTGDQVQSCLVMVSIPSLSPFSIGIALTRLRGDNFPPITPKTQTNLRIFQIRNRSSSDFFLEVSMLS